MRCVLAENVKFALKVLCVEHARLALVAIPVVGAEDDEGLKDDGFLAARSGAQDGAVSGDLTPAENPEAEVARGSSKDRLLLLELDRVVGFEEDVADSVFSRFRECAADVPFGLALKKKVRDAGHDTRSISVAAVRASGTAVSHGTQELPGIGNDFMALLALDMTDEADTARVLLELVRVETLASGHGTRPGVRVALDGIEAVDGTRRGYLVD